MKEKVVDLYSKSLLACINENKERNSNKYSYAVLPSKELYTIIYSLEDDSIIINLIRNIGNEEYEEVINLIEDLDLIGPFDFLTNTVDLACNIFVNHKGINKKIKASCGSDEEPGIYNHVFNLLNSFVNVQKD